jgi:hypothetical protein
MSAMRESGRAARYARDPALGSYDPVPAEDFPIWEEPEEAVRLNVETTA